MTNCHECDADDWAELDVGQIRDDFVKSLDEHLWAWYDFNVAASWNKKSDLEKSIWREAFSSALEIVKSLE
jgi:hypothetical protein